MVEGAAEVPLAKAHAHMALNEHREFVKAAAPVPAEMDGNSWVIVTLSLEVS